MITIRTESQIDYIISRWYAYAHGPGGAAELTRLRARYAVGTRHDLSDAYARDIEAAAGPRKIVKWWEVEEMPLPG